MPASVLCLQGYTPSLASAGLTLAAAQDTCSHTGIHGAALGAWPYLHACRLRCPGAQAQGIQTAEDACCTG